jgi:5-methylcytosine-specific restriction endonuclease McrA
MKSTLGSNKKLAKKHINDILDKNRNVRFHNDTLMDLLKRYHPDGKAKNAIALYYGKCDNHSFKDDVLQIIESDGSHKSISRNACIDALYCFKKTSPIVKRRSELIKALRNDIFNTSRYDFLSTHCTLIDGVIVSICSLCSTKGVVQIDHHYIPFVTIAKEFLEKYPELEIEYNGKIIATLKNPDIRKEWIKHHDSIATFQTLCPPCNLKKSSN